MYMCVNISVELHAAILTTLKQIILNIEILIPITAGTTPCVGIPIGRICKHVSA